MTGLSYERLLSPITIGSVTLRNRIAMMPHAVMFGAGYRAGVDRTIDYHVERAKGGAGLIVMSNFMMPPSWRRLGSWGGNLETSPLGLLDLANDRDLRPHYERMIRGIHDHGGRFVAQLNATGRQMRSTGTTQFTLPLVAPSPLPCPRTAEIPKEMTVEDIEELVATYADAATNLSEAGADGIELFSAQGYLLHEFLSPSSNQRTDAYGGSLENRMRLHLAAIRAIRAATGSDFLVGVRMNGTDGVPGGLTIEDSVKIAARFAEAGVDYVNVSGLTSLGYPGWIADIEAPVAQFATEAARIRSALDGLPVCVSSRIGTPEAAEAVLAAGQADFIGMARALISDPELPLKAARGDRAGIRVCTYSNQSCIVGLDRGRGVGCVHNVAIGREGQIGIGRMRPAPRRRRVAVVGGGPAGMAAARVAAERGHAVTLFEQGPALGGQNLMTAAVVSRRGYGEIHRWQALMLERTGVEIRMDSRVEAAEIASGGWDAAVIATGSRPRHDGYSSLRPDVLKLPGADAAHVFTSWDVFRRPEAFGGHVVVIEDDPHLAGTAAAEKLAELGCRVTIVTPHMHAGADLPVHHAPALYRRLARLGVEVLPGTFVTAIEDGAVACRYRFGSRDSRIEPVGQVVLAMGNRVEDGLVHALAGASVELFTVGDAVAPRQLDAAILDGERAGWMI